MRIGSMSGWRTPASRPWVTSWCRNLKALLSFAVERDLIPVNPLLRIKLPKLESRERVLIRFHPEREPDPAELLAVWQCCRSTAASRGVRSPRCWR